MLIAKVFDILEGKIKWWKKMKNNNRLADFHFDFIVMWKHKNRKMNQRMWHYVNPVFCAQEAS